MHDMPLIFVVFINCEFASYRAILRKTTILIFTYHRKCGIQASHEDYQKLGELPPLIY